ncbi:retrograde transporter [Coprinopsis sp. MPI-PUGE-AT-0042]|nr:retrograde transporter [Coprinopsis sp. MPI-PUGE-AT-0042]
MSDGTSNPSRPQSPVASVYGMNDLPTSRPYRFVWDPSTRRPGPESVAGTTEGGRDYITGHGQYPLGVLNNPSSLNLELGSIPSEWSSAKHGFNAISTVLNHPHKRHAPPKAHSSLLSVPPADLPRVRRKDFDSYLKAITPEWEKYQQNSQLGKEGQAQIDAARFAIPEEDEEQEGEDGEDGATTPRKPAPLSFQGRQIPPLESVPQIFFEQNLSLGDRATFDAVTEQSTIDPVTPTPSSVRTKFTHPDSDDAALDPLSPSYSLPLLEKFSQYADTVEQHLIREISIRSTSFFAALTNLRELQTSSTECLTRIQSLREKLKQVDEGTAKKGLELVRVKRKEDRVKEVADGVKMISGVVEMVSVAKGLVSAGQWGEALEVVEELEEMWESRTEEERPANPDASVKPVNGTPKLETMSEDDEDDSSPTPESRANGAPPNGLYPPTPSSRLSHPVHPVPLSTLTAFASLPSHLQKFTMEIAASLSAEFVAIMKDDWTSYVESDRPIRASEDKDVNIGRDETRDQSLKDRLKPLLLNLVRTKGLKEGMLSWREVILIEFKSLVVKKVPAFALGDDDISANGDTKQALATHLKGLSQSEFNQLLKDIYKDLLSGIERLKAQGDVIQELLTSIKPSLQRKLKPRSSHTIPSLDEDLADILSSTSELANTQVAKIISCRAELHSKLELADFMAFFNESWAFVVRCEVLSRRMIVGLRGTVVSQAKVWLQTFHQTRITQSAKLVEDEVWNPISEVTKELQHIVDIIVDGAVKDAPELVISSNLSPQENGGSSAISPSTPTVPQSALPSAGPNTATSSRPSGKTKQIRIEERTYYVVPATSQILALVLDYLKVIVNMPMLTTDTMSRVIEFLKAFNSRTCQVVLGAGAMRSAGLKNITAKHLALASQSLSVIFELIPYVREAFRRHLSQKQAVMLVEFDKLKRDYQEHQNEIHAKLIAIMSERLDSHIKALKIVDWNVSKEGGGVNDYMIKLVKETVTLHTILARYLRADIVEYVMSEVLAAINHRLSEEYGRIDLPNIQAKEQLLEDTRFLHQNFSPLKHVKAPTGMLEIVVAEKSVPRPPGAAPPTPMRSNTLNANQRLRGLLSGRGNASDPSVPTNPGRTTTTPPVPPSNPDHRSSSFPSSPPRAPSSPSMKAVGNSISNGLATLGIHSSASRSSLSVGTPEDVGTPQQGFRQVDPNAVGEALNGSGPPLPPKPGDMPS